MPAPQRVDRQTFLANLRQSGLVSNEQLEAMREQLPETDRGRLIARALVERGLLTKFQAERLLAGLTGGFVLGQYIILDQLGQGGMGRVFKAEHKTMNRVVALKVLAPNLLKTDKAQQLFMREVRAAARLIHPNIVTAYDANQVGDRSYLVLEYVDGPNLEQLVREQGPLPVGQACEAVRQVAGGLQYAHELGMVHRDIKPANILVQHGGSQCVAKISDFGLARLHDAGSPSDLGAGTIVTKPDSVMGTPDYLSPEQARNLHKADIRSDLYSLGCTFYFLLTGQVPFPGGSTLEKLVRHGAEEATPVEELRADVPPEVAAVVRRLMAKNPDDRFQTPEELVEAVAPFAVCGPAAWSAPSQPSPFADLFDADVNTPALEGLGGDPAADEDVAMIGTLPPGLSPTPISAVGLSSATRLPPAVLQEQRRKVRIALVLAVGIVGGLLGAATILSFLL